MTMAFRAILCLVSIIGSAGMLQAQARYLVLNKPGYSRDISYFAGDPVIFRMKDEKFDRHDEIAGFTDTTIVFNSYAILTVDIEYIKTERKAGFLLRSNGPKLILAGLILPLVDFINYSSIGGNEYSPDYGLYIVSGCIILTGILMTPSRYHKFRPTGNRRIQIRME